MDETGNNAMIKKHNNIHDVYASVNKSTKHSFLNSINSKFDREENNYFILLHYLCYDCSCTK
jgi:hypothetical protein